MKPRTRRTVQLSTTRGPRSGGRSLGLGFALIVVLALLVVLVLIWLLWLAAHPQQPRRIRSSGFDVTHAVASHPTYPISPS